MRTPVHGAAGAPILLLCLAMGVAAAPSFTAIASQAPALRSFYAQLPAGDGDDIVSVEPAGTDVRVRVIRIENVDVFCPAYHVQAFERVLPNTTVQAVAAAPLCTITDRLVAQSLLRAPDRHSYVDFLGSRDTVVATCGDRERLFVFRQPPLIDRQKLRQIAPDAASIWDAGARVRAKVSPYGSDDPFGAGATTTLAERERLGTSLISDLMSEKYATAFGAGYFSKLLRGYSGPPTEHGPLPADLLDRDRLGLVTYVAPRLPQIALSARVFGDVRLRLTVAEDGTVTDVVALSGDKLNTRAAVDAAKQWRFAADTAPRAPVEVTLRFQLRCPKA